MIMSGTASPIVAMRPLLDKKPNRMRSINPSRGATPKRKNSSELKQSARKKKSVDKALAYLAIALSHPRELYEGVNGDHTRVPFESSE